MARRDALVEARDKETGDDFIERVRQTIDNHHEGGQLSIRVGPAFALSLMGNSPPAPQVGASLWIDCGARSESWQRVTGTILCDTYADALGFFGRLLDR